MTSLLQFLLILNVSTATILANSHINNTTIKLKKAALVKKHLKRLKKQEGAIKLYGGTDEYEGNVEILHDGQWGAICDDEWDAAEADVVCRQLGYSEGVGKATHSSHFGQARRKIVQGDIGWITFIATGLKTT